VARPERVELPTFWFVARRSIQLSYGRAEREYFITESISVNIKVKNLQKGALSAADSTTVNPRPGPLMCSVPLERTKP
jgi:hypothetical protein